MDYRSFFFEITGQEPYPYQQKLGDLPWPDRLKIPTGLGKTAAVVVAWLWNRLQRPSDTPRRLIYCLPMRVLVEQTLATTEKWTLSCAAHFSKRNQTPPKVYPMMGGNSDDSWTKNPEESAILIGTQDMLLSRALMRGYGQSQFQWPISFGLLHTDALWVFDEIQLMGSALPSSIQLEAFRRMWGTFVPTRTLWMSATMSDAWFDTIDFKQFRGTLTDLELSQADRSHPEAARRLGASKPLSASPIVFSPKTKRTYPKDLAAQVMQNHRAGTLSLVILNTVDRAVQVYQQLARRDGPFDLVLLHSRFRGIDRARQQELVSQPIPPAGRIVVSTQVVEAGVDLDACQLFTELAPWPSLVQRFGRCNRTGKQAAPAVFWIDVDRKASTPYEASELEQSRILLRQHHDVGLYHLQPGVFPAASNQVLRQKDLRELFDTTPDLFGYDIDIAPFIRDTTDHDVWFFWREFDDENGPVGDLAPDRAELCAVPVHQAREFLENHPAWRWDPSVGEWHRVQARSIFPGQTILVGAREGGYSSSVGWSPSARQPVQVIQPTSGSTLEILDRDRWSEQEWLSLHDHSERVVETMEEIVRSLPLPPGIVSILCQAALLHDVGKAHPVFQASMLGDPPQNDAATVWAKTGRRGVRHARRGFRHELVSGLILLQAKYPDLVCYLVAAHHGRVRVTIRSHPLEDPPEPLMLEGKERAFALGVWDQDQIPEIVLPRNTRIPETSIDLSCMEMGDGPMGPSWTTRVLNLLQDQDMGPFRLAFLEALLRAADARGSEVKR